MRLGQQRNRKLERQPFEKYIFKVKSITPALSLRTRITAVVVLILFASGILITYFNSVATERMLFRDAENSSELIAAEFNLATRSSPKVDTAILKSSARLALRLLPDAEFIGFFQKSDPDSMSLAAFAGRPLAEKELSFIKTTLTNVTATKVSVSTIRSGNSLYSYSILRYNKGQVWGYALTEVTLSKVRQTVRRSQATGAVITLVVSILASILLLLAMRLTFLRPFGDLAKGMREAAGGNMDARLSLSSGTEFRTLSTIFNEMMSELQKAHEIIRSEVKRQEDYNVRLQKDIALAIDTLREKSGEIISLQEKLRIFESQAALGKVASKLAHELGSPLNAIYTSVQLLLENDISAEEKRKLAVIQRQVETMIAIINRSLQARKIAMPVKQKVVLKNLVEETRSVMEPKMRGESIKLDVQLDKPLTILYADPVQIQQVLINLLNNSIEAIEARESKDLQGKIALKAYEDKEQEIENIRFDISDNGGGVSQEVVGQLFNDFINSKKPNGNGIGLVICKEIVDRHGGRIFLSRTSENGSTFSVILPIRDER
ncbi:MAG: ATP-binding protein [Bacteroidetes bacterium]|nr:ATP-binding protein [Bacteroidota bacterium]MCL5737664.1 ATP-binding protein [Bacteroidota bacterium]